MPTPKIFCSCGMKIRSVRYQICMPRGGGAVKLVVGARNDSRETGQNKGTAEGAANRLQTMRRHNANFHPSLYSNFGSVFGPFK